MNTLKRIYLISGANKGIGFGLAEALLKECDPNKIIIITARDENKLNITYENLSSKYKNSMLDKFKLDIENSTDIRLIENFIKEKYGYLNVLYNNAGYLNRNPGFTVEERTKDIIKTFSVNFFSQVLLTKTLLNLILKGYNSHIIFVSSIIGQRKFFDNELNKQFENADLKKLEQLYFQYLHDLNSGKSDNWNYSMVDQFFSYGPSKTFLNSYMSYLNKNLMGKVFVNSFNPGWVKTDMGGANAPLTIEQGIETGLFLDKFSNNKESGYVWEEKKIVSF